MANTVAISRSRLILGVCLPLAVLLGYMLSEPFDISTLALVALVLGVLCFPIAMRWHFPILLMSANAAFILYSLPGKPPIWILASGISLFFLLMDRAMGQKLNFFRAPQVSLSLLYFALVVAMTAYLTGGVGFGSLGSSFGGGKHYIYIFAGIAMYFALSVITIPAKYAALATAVFFLSTLTTLLSYLAAMGGGALNFLGYVLPVESAAMDMDEMSSAGDYSSNGLVRIGSLGQALVGFFCFLMSRYGARGVLELHRPWRFLLLIGCIICSMFSGFRSNVLIVAGTFAAMFFLEGLFKTRYFLILIFIGVVGTVSILPFAQRLPLPVQRSLSFLPINVDPIVRANADDSSDWRLQMWSDLLPLVPKYLIKGKGYEVDQTDLALISQDRYRKQYDIAMAAGDYHSGPLSLIIPLGIFGVVGFVWFLTASLRVLYLNFKHGDPAIRTINTFLLAFFAVRILFYCFVFGSLYSDLMYFTSLIGLSVSLNGGVRRPQVSYSHAETHMELEEEHT